MKREEAIKARSSSGGCQTLPRSCGVPCYTGKSFIAGLCEVSARTRPPRLGADGQLSRRTHPAVQHPRRTAASSREVAGELPEAARQAGTYLRAESRIAAGQAVLTLLRLTPRCSSIRGLP